VGLSLERRRPARIIRNKLDQVRGIRVSSLSQVGPTLGVTLASRLATAGTINVDHLLARRALGTELPTKTHNLARL
jgi:hypothetical protein